MNIMKNKITVYNFYENEKNKDCCVYKLNLTEGLRFVLCDWHGNEIKTFYTREHLEMYLLENKYKKLKWALDVW